MGEFGRMTDKVEAIKLWKASVLERDQNRCVNCEAEDKIAVCFIVPPEIGGRIRTPNGATVCRECRIAAEGSRALPIRIEHKTPINFFISSSLHEAVSELVRDGSKFGSMSALIRRMISSFITTPEIYEDIARWQDAGSDVKINGWVDGQQYEIFKNFCTERGMSYTDTLKALLLMAVDGLASDKL